MCLSKKHYRAVAKILNESRVDAIPNCLTLDDVVLMVADKLSGYFEQDNPRFDPDRFKDAVRNGL